MKALVYSGKGQLHYGETTAPEVQAGEALVEIKASGICGSDLHTYRGYDTRRKAPLILGHEISGVVKGGAWDGRPVVINPLITCGTCEACQSGRDNICASRQNISIAPHQGGFADYVKAPLTNLTPIPDTLAFEKAALTEPLACAWHTARLGLNLLNSDTSGLRALVLGGGAIGLGSALCLKAFDVKSILVSEPNPARRSYLKKQCGITTVPPEALSKHGSFDLILDCVGIDATRTVGSALVKPGGVIIHIGLGGGTAGFDLKRITLHEITVIGSYCFTKEEFNDTARAIAEGRLGPLDWVKSEPLNEGAKAFAALHEGIVAAPKVQLIPNTAHTINTALLS